MLRRSLILLALAALISAVAITSFTGARFTSHSANAGNSLTADRVGSYLHAYSQSTDPGGNTAYATRRGSSPLVPAATGTDEGLSVNLGGYSNVGNTNIKRLFTITTPSSLPAGVSSVTVTLTTVADPTTGSQPISVATTATLADASKANPVTMTAGQSRQVDITFATNGLTLNRQYVPTVVVKVTFNGYTGGFLAYDVPVKIYDGTGAGPN